MWGIIVHLTREVGDRVEEEVIREILDEWEVL